MQRSPCPCGQASSSSLTSLLYLLLGDIGVPIHPVTVGLEQHPLKGYRPRTAKNGVVPERIPKHTNLALDSGWGQSWRQDPTGNRNLVAEECSQRGCGYENGGKPVDDHLLPPLHTPPSSGVTFYSTHLTGLVAPQNIPSTPS